MPQQDASEDDEDEYGDEGRPSSARRRLKALSAIQVHIHTMIFGSTIEVLAKRILMYYRISK